MTKEELEKEAEKWLCNNLHSASEEDFIKAMVDFAEPREKRIADLEKENAEAKEIIREYYNLKNFPCASGNSINMLMYENINHKAVAFLKE